MRERKAYIIDSKHYPYYRHSLKLWRNEFILSLGSNMSKGRQTSVDILESMFMRLFAHKRIEILNTSPIWCNPPFGFIAQDDFYNAVMVCGSDMGLGEIYKFIFYTERYFGRGRKRAFKNAPRTLDIDLICFNNMRLHLPHLHIPHRFYKERPSVMLPLSFIENLY